LRKTLLLTTRFGLGAPGTTGPTRLVGSTWWLVTVQLGVLHGVRLFVCLLWGSFVVIFEGGPGPWPKFGFGLAWFGGLFLIKKRESTAPSKRAQKRARLAPCGSRSSSPRPAMQGEIS